VSIIATDAAVRSTKRPTITLMPIGTSTRNAGIAVRAERILAPGLIRTAPRRRVRQAITTAEPLAAAGQDLPSVDH
jgi:hypothetical protein